MNIYLCILMCIPFFNVVIIVSYHTFQSSLSSISFWLYFCSATVPFVPQQAPVSLSGQVYPLTDLDLWNGDVWRLLSIYY